MLSSEQSVLLSILETWGSFEVLRVILERMADGKTTQNRVTPSWDTAYSLLLETRCSNGTQVHVLDFLLPVGSGGSVVWWWNPPPPAMVWMLNPSTIGPAYSSSATVVVILLGGGALMLWRYRSRKALAKSPQQASSSADRTRPSFRGTSVDEIPGLHARKISRIPGCRARVEPSGAGASRGGHHLPMCLHQVFLHLYDNP
uniref:Uncharacterized protein n=1 Tax=Fagus sylvatica TaxID=28930 RepID=A0A2N9FGS4_FAGSY